ncbi:MAG: DUF4190 domain-containing protein [Oscillospiraceae bacterium]|nr:DUF4190 domain-containing protein [Oscillospiraceae bacterium]
MDEFNNDKNPFDEQPSGGQDVNPYAQQGNQQQNVNPYIQQDGNPYNQQPQNVNPYQQNPYNQQNQQNFNPYTQQGSWQGMAQAQFNTAQQSTGMATASLVLGIISIVMGIPMLMLPPLFILPIIGLVLGIVFKTKHLPVGKGLSTAGIITSSLGIVLPIVFIVAVVIFMMSNPEFMRQYMNQIKEISPEQYQQFYDQFSGQFPEWFESVLYFIFK